MRADLIALTPEAIAALSNVGLVKRAQKEIEQGKGPVLVEDADETVIGTFEDGAIARLVKGKLLRDCLCSCPSTGVCRHRVAVALAYKSFAQSDANNAASDAPKVIVWSPGTMEDDFIERALGKRVVEEARGLVRRGITVEIQRPLVDTVVDVPTARLPSCTVRFLVPNDIVYARCDCALGQGCAHVVLAVWAFREGDRRDPARASSILELSAREEVVSDADVLAIALVLDIVAMGVVNARDALGQRFALAREPLLKDGHVWVAMALDDLELSLERYRARSARYRAADVLALCAEIVGRGRAARSPSAELPRGAVLGRGEALETKLDHLRLVGLGCRFDADDRERSVEILLADPDTGTVLVVDKNWRFDVGEKIPDASELARRRLGPGTIALLARGQLVTRAARRRANRALVLGTATQGASSVTPQTGDFSLLPAPLRVDRLSDLAMAMASRPPRMLRPRVRAEDVHAIRVGNIEEVFFDPAEQVLFASVYDPEGARFVVRGVHRGVAHRALDALGAALMSEDVTWIVGNVTHEASTFVIEPTLVVADRVVVPDIEDGTFAGLPRGRAMTIDDPVSARLEATQHALEEIVQLGIHGVTSAHEMRLEEAAEGLSELGMSSMAARTKAVAECLRAARHAQSIESDRQAARAVIDAAIRLELSS